LKVELCDENRWHVILILFVDKFYFTCVVIVGYLPHTRNINIKIRKKILKYIFLTSKNFLSLFDGIRTLLLLLFILFVSISLFFLIISRCKYIINNYRTSTIKKVKFHIQLKYAFTVKLKIILKFSYYKMRNRGWEKVYTSNFSMNSNNNN